MYSWKCGRELRWRLLSGPIAERIGNRSHRPLDAFTEQRRPDPVGLRLEHRLNHGLLQGDHDRDAWLDDPSLVPVDLLKSRTEDIEVFGFDPGNHTDFGMNVIGRIETSAEPDLD